MFEEFNSLIADTARLLNAPATVDDGILASETAAVTEGLAKARARLVKLRDESLYQVRTAANATDRYVQANPWRTAGIVAAVSALAGLAAGMLIARR
jgi:ElaB/YqjD/DUF883 family membrane-anchored ribosome-binding protein